LKDLGLAMESALHSKSSTPMGATARNLFSLHKNAEAGDKGQMDFSSIQQLFAKT